MGISYTDFLNLTWREYDYYSTGYIRRIERQWDYTRHIIASNYNSSGFAKKTVSVDDIMKLNYLNKSEPFKKVDKMKLDNMIKTMEDIHGNNNK